MSFTKIKNKFLIEDATLLQLGKVVVIKVGFELNWEFLLLQSIRNQKFAFKLWVRLKRFYETTFRLRALKKSFQTLS